MSLKEKPLIDAVSNLGALPGFLFENQIFNGVFTVMMAALFGAFAMAFFSMFGLEDPEVLLVAMNIGAIVAVCFSALIILGIAVTAGLHPEETSGKLKFVFGGFLGVIIIILYVLFLAAPIMMYIVENPTLFGFDHASI